MLPILAALAVVAGGSIFAARKGNSFGRNSDNTFQRAVAVPLAWISGALLLFGSVVYPVSYAVSVTGNADLQAYAATVNDAYRATAVTTGNIESGQDPATTVLPLVTLTLGAAAWGQNSVTAQRWADLRNKVDWYNTLLSEKIAWSKNWFLGLWIAPPPAELAPITFPASGK